MQFGKLPIDQVQGALLAHSHRSAAGRIRKGQLLTDDLIKQLRQDGLTHVTVARLDADDLHEDHAAQYIATRLAADNTRLGAASTGRVNIHATVNGLCDFKIEEVHAINAVHESITLATLPASTRVTAGQIIATVKIIPYAAHSEHVKTACERATQGVRVYEQFAATACLIQTELPSVKSQVLDKTRTVTEHRLMERQARLDNEERVAHTTLAVSEALTRSLSREPDWILIIGASATSDRCDIVPTAITDIGGQIEHFGMPMDPGNLLLLASVNGITIIGMPGCARSKKVNGLDMVLDRMACRVPVTRQWITTLGAGGLLNEIVDRPRPRVIPAEQSLVSGLLLCAGTSSRFGQQNKLLSQWQGRSLVNHAAKAISASGISSTVVVTGHQSSDVMESLDNLVCEDSFQFLYNDAYRTGMASSLIKGVSSLIESDAIVVCLGDMPHVDGDVIDSLIAAFRKHPDKAIYIPVFDKQRGNPVLIARRLFDSVLTLTGDTGARVLAKQFPDTVMEVQTENAGVLQDVDTEGDLRSICY